MKLIIITPTGKYFDDEVTHVKAPGSQGYFGILEGHVPFLTTLKDGTVTATLLNGSTKEFHIAGGLADTNNNVVKILAESVTS